MKSPSPSLFDTAFALAVKAHEGQTRRDCVTPYIDHVRAVVSRLDPVASTVIDMAVAAAHDIAEDTPYTLGVIHSTLLESHPDEGEAIGEIIDGVQTLTRLPNELYTDFINRIATHDGGRWVPIKVADILANLSDSPSNSQIERYARALLVLVEGLD